LAPDGSKAGFHFSREGPLARAGLISRAKIMRSSVAQNVNLFKWIGTSFFGFVPLISKLHSFAKDDFIAILQL
jgi:hypothetical protein